MRKPVVAGRFYPQDRQELANAVDIMLSGKAVKRGAWGIISPHAGYVFSGNCAGLAVQALPEEAPDTVVLLGPNHTGAGQPISVSDE
ncbi:MAG: AmmeMemoRadiSam system protein B, partial [Candidatus Wallbacteria bacterium]|nr:AmmeMemoRadiSam system protein B [Candidatus Wallbacteria bacterium]